MCRIISFVGSRGGVGKTSIILMLAEHIRNQNKKILLIDGYFSINDLSMRFDVKNEIDFKEYITGDAREYDVLNYAKHNLLYLKTNKTDFDYKRHDSVFCEFINNVSNKFDYILIDVNNLDFENLNLFLKCSNETMIVMSDEKIDVLNSHKFIQKIRCYKNITDIKIIINKAFVVGKLAGERVSETDVQTLLETDVLFVIEKFHKFNCFSFKNITKKQTKIMKLFCNVFITNNPYLINYEKRYCGIVGYFRKRVAKKYE